MLNMRRHNIRATGGFRDLNSFLTSFRATFNYNDYQHQEIPNGVIGTVFKNKTFLYDGMFDQKKNGPVVRKLRLLGDASGLLCHR